MNWHPVRPPAKWRLRRAWPRLGTALLLGVWLAGVAWAAGFLAAHHPKPSAARVGEAVLAYSLLWACRAGAAMETGAGR